jgi:hypothetical protein
MKLKQKKRRNLSLTKKTMSQIGGVAAEPLHPRTDVIPAADVGQVKVEVGGTGNGNVRLSLIMHHDLGDKQLLEHCPDSMNQYQMNIYLKKSLEEIREPRETDRTFSQNQKLQNPLLCPYDELLAEERRQPHVKLHQRL